MPRVSFLGPLCSLRAHLQSSMLCVDILNQKMNKWWKEMIFGGHFKADIFPRHEKSELFGWRVNSCKWEGSS